MMPVQTNVILLGVVVMVKVILINSMIMVQMIWNILTGLTFIIAVFLITFMLWISSQINEKV